MKPLSIFKQVRPLWVAAILVLFSCLCSISSCDKETQPVQVNKISIELVNSKGKQTQFFKQGEIPVVILEVVNTGDELRLYPPLHYGEHILLYSDQTGSEPIGNFYSNGQLSNRDGHAIYKVKTVTKTKLPWIWTNELKGKTIEYNLDEEEIRRYQTDIHSFGAADNPYLEKGNYSVKLSLPMEWKIQVAKSEIAFSVN